jgi:diaminopimelate decarboxylase
MRRHAGRGELTVGGVSLPSLAEEFGTPLWVVDEQDLRARCRSYRAAFPQATVAYGSKAWCTVGILQIVFQEGLWIDVVSGGEMYTAAVAGFPGSKLIFHGNNKNDEEIRMAADLGVGRVVVDNLFELDRLEKVGREMGHVFTAWLRITPGITAATHHYISTGASNSKFGLDLVSGVADQALTKARSLEHVDVVGVHAHIGSQIAELEPLVANVQALMRTMADWRDRYRIELIEMNAGGGMAVPYRDGDRSMSATELGRAMGNAIEDAARCLDYPAPSLWIEPGRSIVAPSTVTLYEVGTVKQFPGLPSLASVDGGMSDNIRAALYGASHEVTLANRWGSETLKPVSVVGKHCESGDVLRREAGLPEDLAPGDLLAMAATGAYTASMSSNYNRQPRPAAVLVGEGRVSELVRRESYADLVRHDVPIASPTESESQ